MALVFSEACKFSVGLIFGEGSFTRTASEKTSLEQFLGLSKVLRPAASMWLGGGRRPVPQAARGSLFPVLVPITPTLRAWLEPGAQVQSPAYPDG